MVDKHTHAMVKLLQIDTFQPSPGLECLSRKGAGRTLAELAKSRTCRLAEVATQLVQRLMNLDMLSGFYHTMSRHDRDDYVTVNYDNILVWNHAPSVQMLLNATYNRGTW